jgi:hypothetical protein
LECSGVWNQIDEYDWLEISFLSWLWPSSVGIRPNSYFFIYEFFSHNFFRPIQSHRLNFLMLCINFINTGFNHDRLINISKFPFLLSVFSIHCRQGSKERDSIVLEESFDFWGWASFCVEAISKKVCTSLIMPVTYLIT